MDTILDIIIPVYGKDPITTYDNLKKMADECNENIGMIIVYKNSSKFNYDSLNNLTTLNKNIKVIKGQEEMLKSHKLILGVENSNSRFILPMDAHHFIDIKAANSLIDKLKDSYSKIILMNKEEVNLDTNEVKIISPDWITSGSYIINTNNLKEVINIMEYRVTYADDLSFPLLVLSQMKNEENIDFIDEIIYKRIKGKIISNTSFPQSKENEAVIFESFKKILNNFRKYLDSNIEFNTQFLTAFYFIYNRFIIINEYITLQEFWNSFFNEEMSLEEVRNIFARNKVIHYKFDQNNKKLNEFTNYENSVITLVFPIYEVKEIEINNINYLCDKLPKKAEILVLSDNPNINIDLFKKINRKALVIPSYVNKGKYQVIKDNAFILKTPFVKICDPDDIILIDKLKEFTLRNENYTFDNAPFIRFKPTLNIEQGEWEIEDVNNNREIIRERSFDSVVNENSVIPSADLVNFELDAHNQTKSSDVLISLSHFSKDVINVIDYNGSFYVYNFRKGITGNVKNKNLNMYNQLITFLDIMIQYNEKNKMLSPSFFDYKWAHNFILNTDIDIDDKIKKISTVFDKLKICAKQNEDWKVNWTQDELKTYIEMLEKGEGFIL